MTATSDRDAAVTVWLDYTAGLAAFSECLPMPARGGRSKDIGNRFGIYGVLPDDGISGSKVGFHPMARVLFLLHVAVTMKNKFQRTIVILVASAITMILGTSCSTVRGVGQDVGKAGEHIEDSTR
jgi:predicted small secreted protein